MQPTATRGMEDPMEPPDVFCDLGSLIIEGRLPRGNERGFGEGPHVPHSKGHYGNRHECSQESYMCKKDENFRRHMLLLWQNNVPVSIEVLLSPDCRLGRQKARSVEFSTIPEPGSILLEQWTVSVHYSRSSDNFISSKGLFQAVRSYLHFSQLSAWLSSSRGKNPKNVLFRITIPGEAFASKFSCNPENHTFPPAGVGRSSTVQVSVRSLPRSDEIPNIVCGHAQSPTSSSGEDEDCKLAIAGALSWKEINNSESDLRKILVKARLAECQASPQQQQLPRSDSMDSMLGDSLLDPPQSLEKIPPKRYQSPSRCGSPSLETPEHLLFGRKWAIIGDQSCKKDNPPERFARQDLIRRRDLNLCYGLHPKVLHATGDEDKVPRLSLPLKSIEPQKSKSERSSLLDQQDHEIDDRFFVNCKKSGKHKCQLDEDETSQSKPSKWTYEYEINKTQNNFEELSGCEKKKRSSLHDIFDDGSNRATPSLNASPITQVYRAETEDVNKGDLLLGSIIRTSERNRKIEEDRVEKVNQALNKLSWKTDPEQKHHDQSLGFLHEVNKTPSTLKAEGEKCERLRSLSEQCNANQNDSGLYLDPLDLSFDNDYSLWSDNEATHSPTEEDVVSNDDDVEVGDLLNNVINNRENVPSEVEKDSFMKSLDSAASMVFHQRTGLPLTSSPAPLRKGPKFDFDSTISSPNDIKRALFRADSQKSGGRVVHKTQRRRSRYQNKGLSMSAPATITSSNLLGNFEESVLNGRLEPISTVEGFTAEIGASGSFHPKHKTVPVTVFFYTLGDNSTLSSPYLGHINLGKKGYRVPDKGTIQVTLFNPLGTVVKMFVVMYDLSDMPPNSKTFLRQRTLYMPDDISDANDREGQKWLRYLIHLRFASSKSGKIYLHTDMRMIIFRKSDVDTATEHSNGKGFELRSFTHGPNNPKFSPKN